MKISIDIECTPEEARAFFGLPDLGPLQQKMLGQLGDRLAEGVAGIDTAALAEAWVSAGVGGLEQLGKMFWQQGGKKGQGA